MKLRTINFFFLLIGDPNRIISEKPDVTRQANCGMSGKFSMVGRVDL
jgi:hypothetical protein